MFPKFNCVILLENSLCQKSFSLSLSLSLTHTRTHTKLNNQPNYFKQKQKFSKFNGSKFNCVILPENSLCQKSLSLSLPLSLSLSLSFSHTHTHAHTQNLIINPTISNRSKNSQNSMVPNLIA